MRDGGRAGGRCSQNPKSHLLEDALAARPPVVYGWDGRGGAEGFEWLLILLPLLCTKDNASCEQLFTFEVLGAKPYQLI